MRQNPILVSEADADRLRALLGAQDDSAHDQEHLHQLKAELERAIVRLADEVPADVITMHARVRVRDLATGREDEYTLVLPAEADITARRVSVLAPLGTALLGYREGDEVEWRMPGGLRRLLIVKVTREPVSDREAAGPGAPHGAARNSIPHAPPRAVS
ncbi:MAG: nucleoside diphosphate kinase regulator [Steroidobacteraceae bacterium]|nr:nucleoside diphosphate kinase regulator [Steroidobacteraceae bacterium]